MSEWRPWRVHLLVKSCAWFTLQINLTKHQQQKGLMPGNISEIINIEVTIMSLTLCYQAMDCLQANWWPSIRMAHHNFSMLHLLSVSMSQYRRNNEKNHCRRLSLVLYNHNTSYCIWCKYFLLLNFSDNSADKSRAFWSDEICWATRRIPAANCLGYLLP